MKKVTSRVSNKVIPYRPKSVEIDAQTLIADWLRKLSPRTHRVYRQSISEFLGFIVEKNPSWGEEILSQFLSAPQTKAVELVSLYEGWLTTKGNTCATINRKLASIKSLVNYALSVGKCFYTLSNLKTQPVTPYRDTTGIDSETFKLILAQVKRDTPKGKQDYAILLLLWGNALRRSEVTELKIKDFQPNQRRLLIVGKGKKGQRQPITLGVETVKALQDWLSIRGKVNDNEPLFCAVQKHYAGHQLTTQAVYKLVQKYASLAGIEQTLSPHRLRHSAITAALDATNGDVRAVQKLSRHSSLNTLMVYDDNRRNEQGRVTDLLEELL